MTVEEAKGVYKDRSKWKEVISAYPKGKGGDVMYLCMYVCLYVCFNAITIYSHTNYLAQIKCH
jgi:hypothetical protein